MDRSLPSTGMKRLGMMGLEAGEELAGLERSCWGWKGASGAGNELLGLERSCWGWRRDAGAGEKLSIPRAICEHQGEPQDSTILL